MTVSTNAVVTGESNISAIVNPLTGGIDILTAGTKRIVPDFSKSTKLSKFHTGQLQTAAAPAFNTTTWHQTIGLDAHFDAIQLVIQNVETVGYTLTASSVAATANRTNNVVPTGAWVPVTFGGSASATIPARIAAGVPSITLSDVINIGSIEPTDDVFPYLMIRTYTALGGYSVTGGNASSAAIPQYQGRYFASYKDATGDYCSTNQTGFTKGSAQNLTHITGFILYCRGRVACVMGVGDSITQGVGNAAEPQNSFGAKAYGAISAKETPVVWSNFGFSSQTVDTYFQRLTVLIAAGIKPHALVYAPFSPNNGIPSAVTLAAYRAYLARFYALCDENNIFPIVWTGCPNTAAAWDTTADNIRKTFNAELLQQRNFGRCVIDFARVLGDGATPERFLASMTDDGTHPNGAGHEACAALLRPTFLSIRNAVFGS